MQDQLDIFGEMAKIQQSFYNTIELSGIRLKEANVKANRQEDRVLELFKSTGIAMTPEDVEARYNALFDAAPLTSFRRAITNLTKQGLLVKCDQMAAGKYGKPVHFWRLKSL